MDLSPLEVAIRSPKSNLARFFQAKNIAARLDQAKLP